jgi:hypothetical protein
MRGVITNYDNQHYLGVSPPLRNFFWHLIMQKKVQLAKKSCNFTPFYSKNMMFFQANLEETCTMLCFSVENFPHFLHFWRVGFEH